MLGIETQKSQEIKNTNYSKCVTLTMKLYHIKHIANNIYNTKKLHSLCTNTFIHRKGEE